MWKSHTSKKLWKKWWDFGNRVKFGKGVFINHSAILSASGGIEFKDGVQLAPGVRIATINHDFNERHTKYTYGKVTIKKNAWIGMGATICPGVTIGEYAVVGAGSVVTKDIPDYGVAVGAPVYWGGMPEELFTALRGLDYSGKVIRPFVTHGGSGLANIPNQLKEICEGATVTTGIAITGSTVGSAKGKIESWI